MNRLSREISATLDLLLLGGPFVTLCCFFGVDTDSVGYWVLIGWGVVAVIVLVMDVALLIWAKTGPLYRFRLRRKARTMTGAQLTVEGEH